MPSAPAKAGILRLFYPLLVAAMLLVPALEASHQHSSGTDIIECLQCQTGSPGITTAQTPAPAPDVARKSGIMSRAAEAPTPRFFDIHVRGPPQKHC